MTYSDLSLIVRPPPVGVGANDPRWGDGRVHASFGPTNRTAVVATVTNGSHTERNNVGHPEGTPIPAPLMGTSMAQYRFLRGLKAPFDVNSMRDRPGFIRPSWSLRYYDGVPINDLFNHPGGLRGSYAVSPEQGDADQRLLITKLLPLLKWSAKAWRYEGDTYSPLLDDLTILEESALAGKVWMEPCDTSQTLFSLNLGNSKWVNERYDGAYARRQAFVGQLRSKLGSEQAVTAFLKSAASPQGGMMGENEHLPGWSIQSAGSSVMKPSGTLEVMGAWIRGPGDTYVAERKVHRALSINMFGYT